MSSKYPLAPFAVLYAAGLVVGGVGSAVGLPASNRVAEGMIVLALVATLVLSVVLLRAQRSMLLAWCALVAAVLLLVVEVYALTSDPLDNNIGIGALLLLGWPLGIAGAFTPRPLAHPSVRRH